MVETLVMTTLMFILMVGLTIATALPLWGLYLFIKWTHVNNKGYVGFMFIGSLLLIAWILILYCVKDIG